MDALDSPLEALAVNYVSFGLFAVVNNLWTWVAVLTAALSFWRIRACAVASGAAAPASSPSPHPPLHEDTISNGCGQSSLVSEEKPCPSRPTDVSRAVADSARPLMPVFGNYEAVKGRFTVYYKDDSNSDDDEEMEELVAATGSGGGAGDYCGGLDWWGGWEVVLKVRNGDMGWYRWQDRTLLDGSVVRLWEDARFHSSSSCWSLG